MRKKGRGLTDMSLTDLPPQNEGEALLLPLTLAPNEGVATGLVWGCQKGKEVAALDPRGICEVLEREILDGGGSKWEPCPPSWPPSSPPSPPELWRVRMTCLAVTISTNDATAY